MRSDSPVRVFLVIVLAMTAIAFFPSLFNGFVNWDDPHYVTSNESIESLAPGNVGRIFTSGCEGATEFEGAYCPFVVLSFAIEYRLFKLDPFFYHLTNYTLHIAITALVFYFILFLSGNTIIAFVSAVLFGVHPLHVESVAWVTERKDLLYSLFYFAGLIVYILYLKRKKASLYALTLALCLFSLFSKAMAVTFPLLLILIDYYFARKTTRRVIFEKVPFFFLAAVFAAVNLYFHRLSGPDRLLSDLTTRTYFLLKEIPFYLYKLFVPVRLSALYPYHEVTAAHIAEIKYYVLILGAITAAVALSRRSTKKVVFASAFFVASALPILQVIPAGGAFAADRYMYVSSLGVFFVAAVLFEKLISASFSRRNSVRILLAAIFSAAVILLTLITWNRCKVWKDSGTLFSDVVQKHTTVPEPYNNLGIYLEETGDDLGALDNFKKALIVVPGYVKAQKNFKRVYTRLSGGSGAVSGIPGEIMKPGEPPAEVVWLNLRGVEASKSGDLEKGLTFFKKAVSIDPGHAESLNNLGYAYYSSGNVDEARKAFVKTLEIDPGHKKARMNLKFLKQPSSKEGN
ncbi:MAG: tetratricopeptide repeat protein [Candidatus Omnitrophota bacterium]